MYTKGKWKVEDWGHSKVVTTPESDNEICVISRCSMSRGNEEYLADAQLIASAPDLYEALKFLVGKYWRNKETDGLNGFICCITPEGIPEYWQAADKALVKADGGK